MPAFQRNTKSAVRSLIFSGTYITAGRCAGSKNDGGGFGGCSINLIKEDKTEEVIQAISEKYFEHFNIRMKVYHVKISDGIKEYTNEYII